MVELAACMSWIQFDQLAENCSPIKRIYLTVADPGCSERLEIDELTIKHLWKIGRICTWGTQMTNSF